MPIEREMPIGLNGPWIQCRALRNAYIVLLLRLYGRQESLPHDIELFCRDCNLIGGDALPAPRMAAA